MARLSRYLLFSRFSVQRTIVQGLKRVTVTLRRGGPSRSRVPFLPYLLLDSPCQLGDPEVLACLYGTRSREADADAGKGRGLLIDGHLWEKEHDLSVILGGTYHGSLKFCTGIELVFHTISYL